MEITIEISKNKVETLESDFCRNSKTLQRIEPFYLTPFTLGNSTVRTKEAVVLTQSNRVLLRFHAPQTPFHVPLQALYSLLSRAVWKQSQEAAHPPLSLSPPPPPPLFTLRPPPNGFQHSSTLHLCHVTEFRRPRVTPTLP